MKFRILLCLSLLVSSVSADNRSFDGTGNNVSNPNYGAAGTELIRKTPSAYDPGSGLVRTGQPSGREISEPLFDQGGILGNSSGLSDFIWAWGQFVDHDLDLTPSMSPTESEPVAVPTGDPTFDPGFTGGVTLPFSRSLHNGADPREQLNQITSWHDSSNVYGSDNGTATALRTLSGGKLSSQILPSGEHLPLASVVGLTSQMANEGPPNPSLLGAGDIRANEVSSLIALHTLMLREHNRVADLVSANSAALGVSTDEEIYQLTRKIVGAEAQAVTYHEYLPALGVQLVPYTGYDDSVQPDIANEFSTVGFRLGHTQVSSTIRRVDENGNSVGDLNVFMAFFNPDLVLNGGIESILRGLMVQEAQEVDTHVVDDLRNMLFGPPPNGNDLVAMNIQRGRDHGLPDYNTMRDEYGLGTITSFSEITSDPALASALTSLYGSPDNADPWVGMLAEDHLAGSSVGALIDAIIADQFARLRDGDRFWYQNDPEVLSALDMLGFGLDMGGAFPVLQVRLMDLILANTDIGDSGFAFDAEMSAFHVVSMPEPSTYSLFGMLLFVAQMRRRRQSLV